MQPDLFAEGPAAEGRTPWQSQMDRFSDGPVAAGYVGLVHLMDLGLQHLAPRSPEAWAAFTEHRDWMAEKYRALEIRICAKWDDPGAEAAALKAREEPSFPTVPSEYAVGFASKPAFSGERTAVAKAFALMVRAVGYAPPYYVSWMGCRWNIVEGRLRSEDVIVNCGSVVGTVAEARRARAVAND